MAFEQERRVLTNPAELFPLTLELQEAESGSIASARFRQTRRSKETQMTANHTHTLHLQFLLIHSLIAEVSGP